MFFINNNCWISAETDKKKRIEYIDLAKGFCIMLVVLFHMKNTPEGPIKSLLSITSIFRMPLYFFLSGLFFKEYTGFIDFLKRKTNKLLIPFFSFYFFITVLLTNILDFAGYYISNPAWVGIHTIWQFLVEDPFFNIPIWFLLCLFEVNIFFYVILIYSKKIFCEYKIGSIIVLSFSMGFIGFYIGKVGINFPMYLDTAMTALPFFSIGYFFNIKTNILQPYKYDIFLMPFLCFVSFLFVFFLHGKVNYESNNFYDTSFFIVYCSGLAGSLCVVFLSKFFNRLPLISYWGRYSIMILLTHVPLMYVIEPLVRIFHLNSTISAYLTYLMVLFSYLIVIPLMKKYLPYITAQKDLL